MSYSSKTLRYLKKLNLDKNEYNKNVDAIKKIIKCKNLNEQYSTAYDLICDYLDSRFQGCNFCEFKNDTCGARRLLAEKNGTEVLKNGCCFSLRHQENCKYLGEHGCTIKNVACKLHCCKFLRKKGINYSIRDIYFVKYLFNPWQKYYLSLTFFVPKEEVLNGVKKRKFRIFKYK